MSRNACENRRNGNDFHSGHRKQNSDLYNSSLTHVDKIYYIQTNVRDLLSIKSSFQKIKLYFLY